MFDYASLLFFINLIMGNLGVFGFLTSLKDTFGTIRPELRGKVTRKNIDTFNILAAVLLIGLGTSWAFQPVQRTMDIPSILSRDYLTKEGEVREYAYADGIVGGRLSIEDAEGKRYRFREIYIPSSLEKGDWVKVNYWKNSRIGVIIEINGVEYMKLTYRYSAMTKLLIIFLLLAMPFYFFRVFKWKPFFNWKEDYSICIYHDYFVRGILVVQMMMLQGAVVLTIALMGKYPGFLDWYWGLLVCTNYLGIILLSFFRHKRFVLVKDKFYYCSFKQRLEGSLEEIEKVERVGNGVVIYAKEAKMEILCTKEKYLEILMEKIPGKRG